MPNERTPSVLQPPLHPLSSSFLCCLKESEEHHRPEISFPQRAVTALCLWHNPCFLGYFGIGKPSTLDSLICHLLQFVSSPGNENEIVRTVHSSHIHFEEEKKVSGKYLMLTFFAIKSSLYPHLRGKK